MSICHAPPFAPPQERQILAAREDHESEWWYYHGHLEGGGRQFAFHLAFFRFRIGDIRLAGLVPLKLAADHFRVAHFAVTELDGGKFHYGFKRSLLGDSGASAEGFRTWLRDWCAHECADGHRLCAAIEPAALDLKVTPLKAPLVRVASAARPPARAGATEFSFTRMSAAGRLRLAGEELEVRGTAWMDREFGDFPLKHHLRGWDWFAIQLDDGRELRVYRQRPHDAVSSTRSSLAFVDEEGRATWLPESAFQVREEARWTSPRTGITYPMSWVVESAELEATLRLTPHLRCHELDTRGASNIIYWEGPAAVAGSLRGRPAAGRAFVELVGYENGSAPTGVFDFRGTTLRLWDSILNEVRQQLFTGGVSVVDA